LQTRYSSDIPNAKTSFLRLPLCMALIQTLLHVTRSLKTKMASKPKVSFIQGI
jgi:hypothetical protein